eukprot:8554911-Pyramimonas_sp.AAC.1
MIVKHARALSASSRRLRSAKCERLREDALRSLACFNYHVRLAAARGARTRHDKAIIIMPSYIEQYVRHKAVVVALVRYILVVVLRGEVYEDYDE